MVIINCHVRSVNQISTKLSFVALWRVILYNQSRTAKEGTCNVPKGLDEIDRKIIELLTQNARISYVDIGHAVNLSRVAVKNRIHALEEKGGIEEYTTIVNPQKVGERRILLLRNRILPEHFSAAVERLQKEESVTQIYHVREKQAACARRHCRQ